MSLEVHLRRKQTTSDKRLNWAGVKTTCQKERDIKRLQPVVSMKIPSQFVRASGPWWSALRCDVNGGYSPVQCLSRTSFCWCVDKYGREIPRTRISGTPRCGPMGEPLPNFGALFFFAVIPSWVNKCLFISLRSRSDHVSKGASGSTWMEGNTSQWKVCPFLQTRWRIRCCSVLPVRWCVLVCW